LRRIKARVRVKGQCLPKFKTLRTYNHLLISFETLGIITNLANCDPVIANKYIHVLSIELSPQKPTKSIAGLAINSYNC
jgi:hypothetical protein